MSLFRRRKPLHEQLAEAGGLTLETTPDPRPRWQETGAGSVGGKAADARPKNRAAFGGAGIHGIARAREWDATVTADAPDVGGDEASFTALPDGTLLIDEGPDDVQPLADVVEQTLKPPYRARAARQSETLWAVQGRRIEVLRIAEGVTGDTIELAHTRDGTTLTVDDIRQFGTIRELEARGEQEGPEYVVRAERLDGDLWEVRAESL